MNTPSLSEMARAVLDAYDWTQAQLGEQIGLRQPTIHRIVTGAATTTSYEPGTKLAQLYADRPRDKSAA